MSPDDPRHGTTAGHQAHLRDDEVACPPCIAAKTLYEKIRDVYGDRMVPAIGTRRRVQALKALGHSDASIAAALDITHQAVHKMEMADADRIFVATAQAVARVYAQMCMVQPSSRRAVRIRERSLAKGYAPPLAWDDIDDPNEMPKLGGRDGEIDPVVVERLLAGERTQSNGDEKREAMRRWLAQGRSQRSLCLVHGWQEGRYVERRDGAA